MQSGSSRKDAIRNFKEAKTRRGVFAVRCGPTGEAWVGSSRNVEAAKNGCWFRLRYGSHTEKPLQDAWNRHGEEAFAYEILEVLDDDVPAIAVSDKLKEMKAAWLSRLGAHPLI